MAIKIYLQRKTPSPINLPKSVPIVVPQSSKFHRILSPQDCFRDINSLLNDAELSPNELNKRWKQARNYLEKAEKEGLWSVYGTSPDSGEEIGKYKKITFDLFQSATGKLLTNKTESED